MPELKGECLCGKIKFDISGPIGTIVNCHCSMCRKWHGAAFRTRTLVRASDFRWLSGGGLLSRYDSSPKVTKTFCKSCGSNLVSYYKDALDVIGIPLGGIEGDVGKHPELHIFAVDKAAWHEPSEDIPQHEQLPDETSFLRKIE
ncbi:MAG: GFA family protein [Gammaproteobacteria bacterium]|nr:GFA family protein [Gammaproteobacteria bacterium]